MIRICLIWVYLFCVSAATAGTTTSSDTLQINALLLKSRLLQRTHQDSSLLLAQEAYRLSKIQDYKKGLSGALIRIGSLLYTEGKYDTALSIVQQALSIRKSIHDTKGAAGACILLSYIYESKGKQDSAFAALYEALRLNSEAKDSINLVQTYITLGNLSADYGEHQAALENYLIALKLSEAMQYSNGISLANDGLGNYYFKNKEFEKARYYFEINDSLFRLVGEVVSTAQNLINLALCNEKLLKYPEAKRYYQEAIEAFTGLGMMNDLSLCYYNLGCMYNTLKQSDSSEYYAHKALPIARQTADLKRVSECYELLAKIYAIKGDYVKAYNYHVQFSELNDSLLNKEKITQIENMRTKYESENKEHQIVLLHEQNNTKSIQRNFFIAGTILFLLLAGAIFMGLVKTAGEKRKTEALLLNILPSEVASELKKTGASVAKQYNHVTVLFTDFVNFTGISEQMSPTELVHEINKNFTAFDAIIEKHGLEKIKTIGDAYLAVCGLPHETPDHAKRVLLAALDLQEYMNMHKSKFQLRIGVHSGPVVAGIVGVKKFAYDIWGDTVNTASRMENHSEAGKINISETTYTLVSDKFKFTPRGKIEAKHKGMIEMYFVESVL